MASEQKNTKAEAIRQILAEMGRNASPRDVIARLQAQGIRVTPQQVSNEKAKQAQQPPTIEMPEDLPVSLLKKVKALVDEIGSSNLVRKALDELDALTAHPRLQ